MASYLHGTYGALKDAVIQSTEEASTAAVIIGTLPVHLLPDYDGTVGTPLLMSNASAKETYGYVSDWEDFTLCEAVQAFFAGGNNIGPIYAINVLDPDTHRADTSVEASVTFTGGVAVLDDSLAIAKTIAIANVTDLAVEWDYAAEHYVLHSATATGTKTATYRRVNPDAVTAAQVASAVAVVDDIYPAHNAIPSLLLAPGWSQEPVVYDALCAKAQSIDEHFFAFVVADLSAESATTAVQAIALKATNAMSSKFSKVCWPMVADAAGTTYHLSTLFAREMVSNDLERDGVPFATASNTVVSLAKVCLADGTTVRMYAEDGNDLNEHGISTAIAWGGQLRLWGGHTAGYEFGAANDATAVFDTTMRMMEWVLNEFQTAWIDRIDEPMTIALRDTIVASEQDKLDGLVAQGALVGNPTVVFLQTSNEDSDLIEGNFTWDFAITPTPQFKSAKAIVAYTAEGLNAYITESQTVGEEG